jgi:threonylcarbamoyladenosine tRNA methylthiotransferase MtaB
MDFPPDIVERVAPHFHLPLQHASNRILHLMRRPYTIEEYDAIVSDLRARVPHAAIGTDVIVGFPGETNEDFETLATYLDRSPLTHIHVFPYSERPGTEASMLPAKVHGTVVKERGERIRRISSLLQERFRSRLVGIRRPALTIEDGTVAVSDNYIRVTAPPGHARNEWIEVTL